MRRLVLALAMLFAGLVPVLAAATPATFDTPKVLLDAVYAPYLDANFDWDNYDQAQFRSKALNALFAKDLAEADGDVGRIDFDPFVAGQDFELTNLKVADAVVTGDTATVKVTFHNIDIDVALTYTLVKEDGSWKVDNVVNGDKDEGYDLKALLQAPLNG